ncbi:hypothetical protein CMO91_04780 [Candidatus Woesearchaeota archaeon]|nr:hypothetical protein [Candidatus Woesearchaeota archaeon]
MADASLLAEMEVPSFWEAQKRSEGFLGRVLTIAHVREPHFVSANAERVRAHFESLPLADQGGFSKKLQQLHQRFLEADKELAAEGVAEVLFAGQRRPTHTRMDWLQTKGLATNKYGELAKIMVEEWHATQMLASQDPDLFRVSAPLYAQVIRTPLQWKSIAEISQGVPSIGKLPELLVCLVPLDPAQSALVCVSLLRTVSSGAFADQLSALLKQLVDKKLITTIEDLLALQNLQFDDIVEIDRIMKNVEVGEHPNNGLLRTFVEQSKSMSAEARECLEPLMASFGHLATKGEHLLLLTRAASAVGQLALTKTFQQKMQALNALCTRPQHLAHLAASLEMVGSHQEKMLLWLDAVAEKPTIDYAYTLATILENADAKKCADHNFTLGVTAFMKTYGSSAADLQKLFAHARDNREIMSQVVGYYNAVQSTMLSGRIDEDLPWLLYLAQNITGDADHPLVGTVLRVLKGQMGDRAAVARIFGRLNEILSQYPGAPSNQKASIVEDVEDLEVYLDVIDKKNPWMVAESTNRIRKLINKLFVKQEERDDFDSMHERLIGVMQLTRTESVKSLRRFMLKPPSTRQHAEGNPVTIKGQKDIFVVKSATGFGYVLKGTTTPDPEQLYADGDLEKWFEADKRYFTVEGLLSMGVYCAHITSAYVASMVDDPGAVNRSDPFGNILGCLKAMGKYQLSVSTLSQKGRFNYAQGETLNMNGEVGILLGSGYIVIAYRHDSGTSAALESKDHRRSLHFTPVPVRVALQDLPGLKETDYSELVVKKWTVLGIMYTDTLRNDAAAMQQVRETYGVALKSHPALKLFEVSKQRKTVVDVTTASRIAA